jgi:hypothetical protein
MYRTYANNSASLPRLVDLSSSKIFLIFKIPHNFVDTVLSLKEMDVVKLITFKFVIDFNIASTAGKISVLPIVCGFSHFTT